jgi:hypothetical protein
MAATGGDMRPRGEVRAEKNPERAPASAAARFAGATVTVRYDGDSLAVRVGGSATFGSRTAAQSFEVKANKDLKDALDALLDEHRDEIEAQTMGAAYEAVALARRRGEEV